MSEERTDRRREPLDNPVLYIGNLDFDVTNREIVKKFQKFGEIVDVRLKP